MEDLVVFGKNCADPWNRVSCCRTPVLLAVEFCQVQGPKPLLSIPEKVEDFHLSLEEVAIWLMSSENNHGTFSCLYNQQLGVYVYVQYVTLLDVTARAFQRPFAIALLTPYVLPTDKISAFQSTCIDLLRPLLACNRQYFRCMLKHILSLASEVETKQFNDFYAISGSKQSQALLSNKIKSIAQQARPWYERLTERSSLCHDPSSICECDYEAKELEKFVHLLNRKFFIQLTPLLDLAPCAKSSFINALEDVYKDQVKEEPVSGLLFSAGSPVLRSFFGANSQLQKEEEIEENSVETGQVPGSRINENSLKAMSYRLIRCMYPLLAGERIAVLASHQRSYTGRDLLEKLNSIRISKRSEPSEWFSGDDKTARTNSRQQVIGVSCGREKSASQWPLAEAPVIIDLNNHCIRSREYTGRLLFAFYGKRFFPSDKSLSAFIAAIISDIQQLVLLAKYTSPHSVVKQLRLDLADQLILYNFLTEVNLTKYSQLKHEAHKRTKNIPYVQMKL